MNAYPPDPVKEICVAELLIIDEFGVTQASDVRTFDDSMPETIMWNTAGGGAFRVKFRAVIKDHAPDPPCKELLATVEVYDIGSGETMLVGYPPDPIVPQGK